MKQRCRRRSREEHSESRCSQGEHREGASSTNAGPLSQICPKEGRDSQGSLKSRVLPGMCPPAAPPVVRSAIRQVQAPRRPPWPQAGRAPAQWCGTAGRCRGSSATGTGAGMRHAAHAGKSCHRVTPHTSRWPCTDYCLGTSALCLLTLPTAPR